jgi:hypothetical protein
LARAEEPQVWNKLFDGETLDGWQIAKDHFFDQHGEVSVRDKTILMASGDPATGIAWTGEFPRSNYEVRLDARRVKGSDFFCGMTFPVGEAYCTFIAGGWGGGVTGLSNIDNIAAVENETTDYINVEQDKWYSIRLRVTDEKVQVWIDEKQMVDVDRGNRKFSIWFEQEPMRPFGIASCIRHRRRRRTPSTEPR